MDSAIDGAEGAPPKLGSSARIIVPGYERERLRTTASHNDTWGQGPSLMALLSRDGALANARLRFTSVLWAMYEGWAPAPEDRTVPVEPSSIGAKEMWTKYIEPRRPVVLQGLLDDQCWHGEKWVCTTTTYARRNWRT